MWRSRFRPSLLFLLLGLAACSGGGATPPPEGAGPNAAAFLPLSDHDMGVPPGGQLPPGAREALARRGGSGPCAPQARPGPQPDLLPPARPPRRPSPLARPVKDIDRSGPQIRVTWEALAVERERLENPRFRQGSRQTVLAAQQKVVLVNESHVEAQTSMLGVTSRQNQGVAVAAIPNADMQLFLRGLEQRGYFQVARPTSSVSHLLEHPNARGRVTIERNGQSWSLVSMRGQGLNPATKRIPPLYSETKQSVMMLRNQVSCMSVVGVQGAVLIK